MVFHLLSVLSAAVLAAAGSGAADETRSAQSFPVQNLIVAQAPAGSDGKLRSVRHLTAAASDQSDESRCERNHGYWDNKQLRCLARKGGWWSDTGARLLIGAGAVAGIAVAVSGSGHQSVSN